jgi:hypothetical protein
MNNTLNIQMLIKLLRMTESSHDGEVLNAARMANALLNKHNVNWDEALRGQVPMVDADPFATIPDPKPKGIHYDNKTEIDAYFEQLNQRDLGSFRDYVVSVHEWWTQKGFLTQKQYDVIKKSAARKK